ncbi:hypothetical protein DPMN_046132 [Dreissena polymorpha]|uniref:Integrase zinc-binding domain-containing protein n=1 Tax=Dreissena polymorpha TaxID=45954 RepID=A0A9D4HXY2_DREPO|nr:hypothetical protein DPMN_046132 [Dreissena polymorpha]
MKGTDRVNINRRHQFKIKAKKFFLKGKELFKYVPGVLNGVKVVRMGETADLLKEFHASGIGGHSGFNKTNETMKIRFWWPKMTHDIREYKAECLVNNLPALTLGQSHVAFFRNYVRGRLLASGDRHTYLCNALQCIDPRGQLKWLNCDVCGRWVHEKCIGTGLDTEGFRCDICNVQYS